MKKRELNHSFEKYQCIGRQRVKPVLFLSKKLREVEGPGYVFTTGNVTSIDQEQQEQHWLGCLYFPQVHLLRAGQGTKILAILLHTVNCR